MKQIVMFAFTFCLFAINTNSVNAQVTIGSDLTPEPAAILQLKQRTPANPTLDNSNSDKGLGLPRVELQSLTSLEPFLGTSTSAEILMLHQGLMIYNLTDRPLDGLEPGVYVWDGKSFWVKNDQINPSDFALDFSLDGIDFQDNEIVFSSGLSTVALTAKVLTIDWKPKSGACDLIWVSEESDKILWSAALPNTTGTGGSFNLNLNPLSFVSIELGKDPFLEKTTTLIVRARNQEGGILSKSIKIKQIHHAINIKGIKDGVYIQLGKEYKVNIASNLSWQMTTSGATGIIDASTIPTSAIPNIAGTDYTFKLLTTPANEGQEVTLSFKAPNGEVADMPITLKATKEYANSYMGTPRSTISVPIRQAYIAWKNELDRDLDLDNSKMSVELVWQDIQNLIGSVSFINDGKTGVDRTISVTAKTDATRVGNALVAFKIDNEIVWSWHIWVTDYVPNTAPAAQGVVNVAGGKVYNRNNGTRNYIIMDRDLGALVAVPVTTVAANIDQNYGMMGFFYQWGRKDPFPPKRNFTTAKARILYNISNQALNPGTSGQGLIVADVPTNIKYNVINAINSPMTFYKGAESNDNDWYSAEVDVVNSEAWLEYYKEAKAIYDPCPQGWRVPVSTYTPYSLYHGLLSKAAVAGYIDYTAEFHGNIAFSGTILSTGNIITDDIRSDVWFADISSTYHSPYAWVSGPNKVHWVLSSRSTGMSVRCVKK